MEKQSLFVTQQIHQTQLELEISLKGALIVGVFIDSPADKAGIQAGDIMVVVDGKDVTGVRDLLEKISLHRPGDAIEVTIYRGPKQLTVTPNATERPQ